mmetsp:Transcript_41933/g.75562  ORF Transcript_41933/g.75562 Transcript_41933/m.75562 type:complete len:285 (-) Transcript_41933:307-1161(-)|eukprot:CAMPEP_0201884122 /NCGR_PEP_ID=MMETSP0902-20130614/16552_1 /ASSEMBLY_ACC=CAM_ASM_000551 /TAXON_ID=420261 /ORGANISM="Thalassiosira antarctica, Strain CCMP982" /LENGTH=284 /DNA_ID=CAMNT_0048413027 /DNA_START=70 /DNA_END=924 /DNA_ORIENTATION=+
MRFSIALLLAASAADAFVPSSLINQPHSMQCRASRSTDSYRPTQLFVSAETTEESVISTEPEEPSLVTDFPPILEELRNVAMRLHTKKQAPREGEAPAPAKPAVPYVPTHTDYLQFLVDSNAVYVVLEEIVNSNEKMAMFRNSGLERTKELEKDIAWMCDKYELERPDVGKAGKMYADELKAMVKGDEDIPEFMCHYYNHYFAHLAGGRMIGKSMSKLLLDGETLEFYKWGEDVNELKPRVKNLIEEVALQWSREERDKCINATAGAFKGGGAINGYLGGGSPH